MNTSFHKIKVVSLIFAFAATYIFAGEIKIKVGDTFPELSQFKLEGKLPENLSGKIVLIDFWASWCAPCKASFPTLEELQKNYAEKGVVVISINVDEKKSAMESFLKKRPVTFVVLRDAEQKLVASANVETMPTSFLLDGSGKVRFVHSGFHGAETKKQYVAEIEELLKSKN